MSRGITVAAGTATWVLVASQLTGCLGGCEPHLWDGPPLTTDQRGVATPRDALHTWIDEGGSGPDEGWRRDGSASTRDHVIFVSGDWHVTATRAPAGGYVVTSGGCG